MRDMQFSKNLFRQILSLIILAGVLGGAFSVRAQTKRAAAKTASTKQQPSAPDKQNSVCRGGWSGVVTFTKTLNETVNQGKKKNIARGTTHITYSRDYKYNGRIFVDGSKGANLIETKSQVTLRDERNSWKRYEQYEDCAHDRVNNQQLQWSETEDGDLTNAFSDEAANFNLRVDELSGNYDFSFRFPEAAGTEDRTSKVTKGGWCSARLNEGDNRTAKYPVKVSGEQVEISDQKISPKTPDVLTGTKTWDSGGSNGSAKWIFTLTWTFKRCPAPVEVTDIRFDEHIYPSVDTKAWKEMSLERLLGGTYDGNLVRIRATVTNFSNETKFPGIKFSETVENWTLPDGETSIRLEPGESREVELIWDTAGYAWRGKGWDAESYRGIKVEAVDGARTSQMSKLVVVNPRPVILVHGLWSNAAAWAGYGKFFEEGHSRAWKAYAVGANPAVAKMNTGETFGSTTQTNTISQNAVELRKQIEWVRKELNAWHVDIVAHSMGGLIARYYIQEEMQLNYIGKRPAVTRLLMLGTPNQGSPCAESMFRALSATGSKPWALYELIPSVVERFNQSYRIRKGVRFSSLVGWRIPATCHSPARGDGVVSVDSARWRILDWKYSDSLSHTDLTSRTDFGAFVFPRLSIGPRGDHSLGFVAENDAIEQPSDRYGFNSVFQKASFNRTRAIRGGGGSQDDPPTDGAPLEGLTLAKQISLSANQTTEIEIPMTEGSRATIVFAAAPDVSATLFDAAGKIVGTSVAGTAESKQMFRTIAVEKPVAAGVWKLKLENKARIETSLILAAFADPNPLALELTVGKPNAAGQIALQARLTNNGSPVSGANLKAQVQSADGKSFEVALSESGGLYAANLEKLADGDYSIEAVAETGSQTRRAWAALTVGAARNEAMTKKKK